MGRTLRLFFSAILLILTLPALAQTPQATTPAVIEEPAPAPLPTETEVPVAPAEKPAPPSVPLVAPKKEQRRLKRILATFEITIDDKPAGTFKAQLFPDKAPLTVANFTDLAEGKKQFKEFDLTKGKIGDLASRPFYDGLIFHRIVPEYVIQGGCPLGTGRGGTGEFIPDEINKELHHNAPGILAMASSGRKDSNSSQFYITLRELNHLDGKYTIFGKVVEGMDVVNKIGQIKSDRMTQLPLQKAVMKSVKITREYLDKN